MLSLFYSHITDSPVSAWQMYRCWTFRCAQNYITAQATL